MFFFGFPYLEEKSLEKHPDFSLSDGDLDILLPLRWSVTYRFNSGVRLSRLSRFFVGSYPTAAASDLITTKPCSPEAWKSWF